jgi:ABC-2 type transport system ATP-binding protein
MSEPAAPILVVLGLHFAYPTQPPLASGWSAAIGPGVTLLHGDTGSGKSTLLRCLAGELPAAGRLTLAGVRLDADREAYRRRVFPHPLLINPPTDVDDQATARACTVALSDGDVGFDAGEWQDLVDGFALTPHLDKPLYMLSTGSKRKVWLAAALASGRALVLLDEPAGALDAASVRCLRAALGRRTQRRDAAVVVASAERLEGIDLAAVIGLPLR